MYLDVLFLPFSVHKVKCILPSFNVTQGHSFLDFTWTFLLLEGLDGPGGGSFDVPGDWFVISGVGSETGSREGGGTSCPRQTRYLLHQKPLSCPYQIAPRTAFAVPFQDEAASSAA